MLEDEERQLSSAEPTADQFELYALYREYIKHEDDLMGSRLGACLTLTSFLLAASMVILGSMVSVIAKMDVDSNRLAVLLLFGTGIHGVLAWIGHFSATVRSESILAATKAIGLLRDQGNETFRAQIASGKLPPLTNGRLLEPDEMRELESGLTLMRHIPRMMQRLWLVIGASPLLLLAAVGFHRFA